MAEILCPGTIHAESEFLPVNETHFGKCGENMQAALQSWATQQYRSTLNVYTAMRDANRCDLSGASNMGQQHAQALADGFKVDYLPTNTGMSQATWRTFLLAHLPKAAVGIEVANGQALKDYLTGLGEDASNLSFHFVSVFGHHGGGYSARANRDLPAGWWVADGDNYANNTHTASGWDRHLGGHTLCFYTEATLAAARPCAALAVYPRVLIAESKPGGINVALPTGWHDDGTKLSNPTTQFVVVQGKRDFILANDWDAGDVPLENTQNLANVEEFSNLGAGNAQTFRQSRLIYANSRGKVQRQWLGDEYLHVRTDRDALAKQVAALQAQLAPAQHDQPTVADPLATKALAVVQELGALLKEF